MAYDCYLLLDGIEGESTDSKHKNWIEVLSFNTGVDQGGSSHSGGGASTTGRANFADFTVTKYFDKSTPKLSLFCAQGEHIKSAKIEMCQATKEKNCYMRYTLSDVLVSSVRPSGSSGDDRALPVEEVTLRYHKIEWEYTPMDAAGKPMAAQKAVWDLKTNLKG